MLSLKNMSFTICFLGFVFSSSTWAGSVENNVSCTPTWNEYSDNEVLSADTLNNHFDAIADAINDNDATKTHYLTVPSASFRPVESDTTYTGGSANPFMSITGGTLFTIAAVNIPHGAVITDLSIRAWDVSTTNSITIDLRKHSGSAATTSIALVATTTAENAGYYVRTDSTPNEVVDLSTPTHNFYYLLQTVEVAGTSAGPAIYAARITYTY